MLDARADRYVPAGAVGIRLAQAGHADEAIRQLRIAFDERVGPAVGPAVGAYAIPETCGVAIEDAGRPVFLLRSASSGWSGILFWRRRNSVPVWQVGYTDHGTLHMMEAARVDAVFGYALAVAAQADDRRDRELGPIHLLKYLYLADLSYAEKHRGESYSGTPWRFYKFGPWAEEIFLRISPAMETLEAARRSFASQYREDNLRWSLPSCQLELREADLPNEVARAIAWAVREFGSDTSALLHHVYRTYPMLRAAPNEPLDLTPVESDDADTGAPQAAASEARFSKTKVKKLRALVQDRLAGKRAARSLVQPDPPPRYDDVFAAGAAWLDGPEPEPQSGHLSFSDDIWHSPARGDSEFP